MIEEARIAVVQIGSKVAAINPQDKDENVKRIIEKIELLGEHNDLVVFPETCVSGYIPVPFSAKSKVELWEVADDLQTSVAFRNIFKASEQTDCLFIFGFIERSRIKYEVYDSAALVAQGKILGIYRKVHLGGEEHHYFIPGPEPEVFKTRIGIIGMSICYDMVFPEQARVLGIKGAEIIVFSSGWANIGNLRLYARYFPVARALENQVHVIFCNSVGVSEFKEKKLRIYGESKIVSATGEIVAESTTDREEVITGILKRSDLEKAVCVLPVFRDRHVETYSVLNKHYD